MSDYAILQQQNNNNKMQQFVRKMIFKAERIGNVEMEMIMRAEEAILKEEEQELRREELESRDRLFRKVS